MLTYGEVAWLASMGLAVAAVIVRWLFGRRRSRRHAKQRPRFAAVSFDPTIQRVHSLDGLRAVSAALVTVSHFGLTHLVPGGLGVTCFFFISGFLITRLLLAEFDTSLTINIAGFYRRRFWRLWPAIAAAVLGAIVIGAAFGEVWAPLGHVVTALLFVQNYWWFVDPGANPLNIQWSLAIEFHFYLLWPVALVTLLSRRGVVVPAVATAIICFLAFRIWITLALAGEGVSLDQIGVWTYKLTHFRGDSLLFGCLLALAAYDRQWRSVLIAISRQTSIWLGIAILLGTLVFRDEFFRATFRYSIQGVGLFLIFSGLLFAERGGIIRWALNLPIMSWLGAISFSVYLWHMTLWRAMRQVTGQEAGFVLALVTAALTLFVAWLSYRFIEQRFIGRGRRPRNIAATAYPRFV